MRLGLSGMMVGLMLVACVDQHPPVVAVVPSQPGYSTCAPDECKQPRLAATSTDISTAVATDRVPTLDVEPLCGGLAGQGGATFRDPEIARVLHDPEKVLTKKDCLDSEAGVRAELTKAWASFDVSDRVHCMSESEMGGESSYTELITCLEMARDVRKLRDEDEASPPAHNENIISNR
jgi:hypothetical protein